MLFAEEGGPAFIVGAFQAATGAGAIRPALEQAFRTGEGLPWQQHDHQVFHGTERFYRSGYIANLVSNWIPSIAGAQESLTRGGCVADIGLRPWGIHSPDGAGIPELAVFRLRFPRCFH